MLTLSSRAAGSSVAFLISAQGSVFITAPRGPDQYWPLSSVITNHISALALASSLELSINLHEVLQCPDGELHFWEHTHRVQLNIQYNINSERICSEDFM